MKIYSVRYYLFIHRLPLVKMFPKIVPVWLKPKASSQFLIKWQKVRLLNSLGKKKYLLKLSGEFHIGSKSCNYFSDFWRGKPEIPLLLLHVFPGYFYKVQDLWIIFYWKGNIVSRAITTINNNTFSRG